MKEGGGRWLRYGTMSVINGQTLTQVLARESLSN